MSNEKIANVDRECNLAATEARNAPESIDEAIAWLEEFAGNPSDLGRDLQSPTEDVIWFVAAAQKFIELLDGEGA